MNEKTEIHIVTNQVAIAETSNRPGYSWVKIEYKNGAVTNDRVTTKQIESIFEQLRQSNRFVEIHGEQGETKAQVSRFIACDDIHEWNVTPGENGATELQIKYRNEQTRVEIINSQEAKKFIEELEKINSPQAPK